MSLSLLAKLKVKPIAKKKEDIEVIIPVATKKEDIVIKANIVDKRNEGIIDRDILLQRIKNKLPVQPLEEKTIVTQLPITSQAPITILQPEISERKLEGEEPGITKLIQPIETEVKPQKIKIKIKKTTEEGKKTRKIKIKTLEGKETEPQQPISEAKQLLQTVLMREGEKIAEEKTEPKVIEEVEESKEVRIAESKTEGQEIELAETKPQTIKIKIKRTTKPKGEIIQRGPLTILQVGDTTFQQRLPREKPKVLIRASNYYMSNRQIFINFITSLFERYKEQFENDKLTFSCDEKDDRQFNLLTHQKLIRDYINIYTPYRGLLLYHGLGSGKTCSSIAIAEGIKSDKQIIVMTPASLRMNYIESLKKCGDEIYKKNQYWEFINVDSSTNIELINQLSFLLSLSDQYIIKNNGAWLVNIKKKPNYEELTSNEKKQLDNQLNEMIKYKYSFINYNGLRNDTLVSLTQNYTVNPFDNKVVIIDEAHNFVSRIVNKINRKELYLSTRLYNYIMDAKNAKIVLLTGTPIINYPNELGILFNMLRGKIKTWSIKLIIESSKRVSQETLYQLFKSKNRTRKLLDYIDYKPTSTTLIITRNPFGFGNKFKNEQYEGIELLTDSGEISDEQFIKNIIAVLKEENISIAPNGIEVNEYKTLPDTLEQFKQYFINQDGTIKNQDLFKRRILGLVSYFSDIEKLMPRYNKIRDFKIIRIPMSDYQFLIYENARSKEREEEIRNAIKSKKKNDIYDETLSSTYRIFSRLFCNFVFPETIGRPFPVSGRNKDEELDMAIQKEINEDDIEAYNARERIENDVNGIYEADDEQRINISERIDTSYAQRIDEALNAIWVNKDTILSQEALQNYSPKFLSMIDKISDTEKRGLHLVYSQFRSVEGIGIFKMVLEYNGYAQFKIRKNESGIWEINIKDEDKDKPMFALYTGTETSEEKEIIRNIFNNNWKFVPDNITRYIKNISNTNLYGDIIKVLIISASGAEGIDLKNVRYVHLMESYWHPVRIEQVIGRARRICSHKDLPLELQTVEVFLYLMIFTEEQLKGDSAIELKLKDRSKIDPKRVVTSDETLYEISVIKENVTMQLLKSVKEASIDCTLNVGGKENIQCFSFGNPNKENFSITPSLTNETLDTEAMINKREIKWKAQEVTIQDKKYVINKFTNEIYDYNSYILKNPILLGNLEKITDKTGKTKIIVKWI